MPNTGKAENTAKPTAKPEEETNVVETIQSLIVAFALAMGVRSFVTEGFVIPTGSMAPTLMGLHVRATSPDTGYTYPVDAGPAVEVIGQLGPSFAAYPREVCDPMLSLQSTQRVGETTLGTLVANLGFDKVVTPKPVFIGDTLRAETEVIALKESKSRPDAGVVTFLHRCLNQRNELVCQTERAALLKKA